MKLTKNFLLIFAVIIVFTALSYGYLKNIDVGNASPEITLEMFSPLSKLKSKIVAASCGFGNEGHSSFDYTPCTLTINCCYGGPVTQTGGTSLCGGTCVTPATIPDPSSSSGFSPQPICQNHPQMGQSCTTGTDACGVTASGTRDACGVCVSNNTAPAPCTVTNVCGQTFSGSMCNGVCTAGSGSDINASCIKKFNVTTDSVNPNGSVEFSWEVANEPGVGSRCGFVDLTTAVARPIPGLQNLDPNTDKVRITNIQTTTRFCLVCQFYNLTNNNILGDAAAHQWIRVIRIGEN